MTRSLVLSGKDERQYAFSPSRSERLAQMIFHFIGDAFFRKVIYLRSDEMFEIRKFLFLIS